MYSQEASKDQGFLDRHIIDNLVFAPQPGKEEDEKQKYYRMNTFSTLGYDKDDPKSKPILNYYLNTYKEYGKNLLLGRDNSKTKNMWYT